MQDKHTEKIQSFYEANRRMPTYSEMMKMFGYKSKNAVYKFVNKMLDAGIVTKDHLGRLVPGVSLGEVPLLGTVTAGFPREEEEQLLNTISLDDLLIQKRGLSYFLEVDGDSMIDAHIESGDLILVEKTQSAKDGDIVIAEVDGEFTLKYLRERGTKRWLEPANKAYKPIYPTQSLQIVAKLKAVIRKY